MSSFDESYVAILASQSALNEAVSRALQAFALTTDRYDAEIEELRDEIAQLGSRVAWLCRGDDLHSRRVPS